MQSQSPVRFNRVPEKSGSTGFRTRFQTRSGRLWCRARSGSTRFRTTWEALVQSQVRFKVPEKVPVKVWEALVQSQGQVRFNRAPEKVPEKVLEACVQSHAGQVQQGSGQGSREGLGGFGAEPGQVQGSREGSGEGLGGFGAEPEPGQVQQGSGEGSGEGLGGLCAEPCRSGSTGFRTRFQRRSGRLWCRAKSGSRFQRRFR